MKRSNRRRLVWTIVLTVIVSTLTTQNCVSQNVYKRFSAFEFVVGTEDVAKGVNYYYMNRLLGGTVGAEFGTYKTDSEFVDHQKYRYGIVFNPDGSSLISVALCHNEYQFYNQEKGVEDIDLPKLSLELGVKYCFPDDRMLSGFTIDLMHRTGSFNFGFKFGRK